MCNQSKKKSEVEAEESLILTEAKVEYSKNTDKSIPEETPKHIPEKVPVDKEVAPPDKGPAQETVNVPGPVKV